MHFAYWFMSCDQPEPLIVIADGSRGLWVHELLPRAVAPEPIEFFDVRDGHFGPVLQPYALLLVRDDLLNALRESCVSTFSSWRTSIGPAQCPERRRDYSIIKTARTVGIAELCRSPGIPTLAAVVETPGFLVVSSELRELVEPRQVEGLRFVEPLFAGHPPNPGLERRQDRLLNDDWIATAGSWIRVYGETLLSIKYLYNSPPMNFALLSSPDQLHQVIHVCPDGAELTLWRESRLAIRGALTSTLLERARSSIPEQSECVCLFTATGSDTDPRLEGDSWRSVSHMLAELEERMGESVVIGAWPDSERIQAVKGGLEGPR